MIKLLFLLSSILVLVLQNSTAVTATYNKLESIKPLNNTNFNVSNLVYDVELQAF